MAWESVDNPNPAKVSSKVPPDGITLGSRAAMRDTRYLVLQIGAELARKTAITHSEQKLRLMVGTGSDGGKLAVAVDAAGGQFIAKRQKAGHYKLTISRTAADGLFSLSCPAHSRAGSAVEVIRPSNGQPVHFVFRPDAELFKIEGDR